MSTWQRAGKPFEFDRAREAIQAMIGNERGRALLKGLSGPVVRERFGVAPEDAARVSLLRSIPVRIGAVTTTADRLASWDMPYATFPPATDIIAGHIEHGNAAHPDPFFYGAGRRSTPTAPSRPREGQRSLFG